MKNILESEGNLSTKVNIYLNTVEQRNSYKQKSVMYYDPISIACNSVSAKPII